MGFAFHGHKRDVDAEKHLARLHKTTPLIESPLVGADSDSLVFSQRHEANSVELFFDLFFVANLATFTAYHSITDVNYLLGYIGFFAILWCTWFQITLHDVRFARDSLYERCCKTIQFIVFVGLALVGSQFNPASVTGKANIANFQLMCYVLVISRGLLTIQYSVVLYFTFKARYSKLYLPIGLMIAFYLLSTGVFVGMSFKTAGGNFGLVYLVWYAMMALEAFSIVGVSCFWRMLSFKKTHLMERMSLLTIIVIGEGAIGVTKTVSRIMGKGLDMEGCFLVMCIIVILVLLWALYFDNFPHGHYGTIRQQFWSLLHFPLQLAIVGVVEGAQQLALARYVLRKWNDTITKVDGFCIAQNLDGKALTGKLFEILKKLKLDGKVETREYYQEAVDAIYNLGNATGICSPANATKYVEAAGNYAGAYRLPVEFANFDASIANGLYTGLGLKIPAAKLENYEPIDIAFGGWHLVYMYFWASFTVLIACLIIFLFLIRRHKVDLFDYTSVIFRFMVLAAGVAMMSLMANMTTLYNAIASPALLPICVVLLFLITCVDKISSIWANHRLQKSGDAYVLEEAEEHGHAEHGHSAPHELHGLVSHENSGLHDVGKQSRWSTQVRQKAHSAGSTPPSSPPLQAVSEHAAQGHGH